MSMPKPNSRSTRSVPVLFKSPRQFKYTIRGDKKTSNYSAFLLLVCLRKYTESLGRLPKSDCGSGAGRRVSWNMLEEMTGAPGGHGGEVEEWRLFCWVDGQEG